VSTIALATVRVSSRRVRLYRRHFGEFREQRQSLCLETSMCGWNKCHHWCYQYGGWKNAVRRWIQHSRSCSEVTRERNGRKKASVGVLRYPNTLAFRARGRTVHHTATSVSAVQLSSINLLLEKPSIICDSEHHNVARTPVPS
jgi:hypothetical protein